MTQYIDALIQNALMAQLTTPALSGNPPIASPFVAYTPTPNVAYLDARPVLRANVESPALAFHQSSIFRGIFQVDAVIPDGAGEAPGSRLAALVVARFDEGTKLAMTGVKRYLIVNGPASIATAVKDAPWVRFPVSIPFTVIN